MTLPTNIVPVLVKELEVLGDEINRDYMLDVVQAYVDCDTEMIRATHGYGRRCMCDE